MTGQAAVRPSWSLPPRGGVASSTRPDGLVWGSRGGGVPAGGTLPRSADESQLCRSVIKKWRFRRVTTGSRHGRRDAPLYVYSVFEWCEHDKRAHGGSRATIARTDGGGAGRGAGVCRFAIDLTTKRPSHRLPTSSPTRVPLPVPPKRQSIGPPGGYWGARPGCAPTHGPRPQPASRRPPAVPVQKGATDKPQRIASDLTASPHRIPQGAPVPPMATAPSEPLRQRTAGPDRRCSPHLATIPPGLDQDGARQARTSERTG